MPNFEASPCTVRLFFKNIATADGVLFGRQTTSPVHGWRLRYEDAFDRIYFQDWATPGADVYSRRWVYAGGFDVWRELVFVISAADVALYVDGVLIDHDETGEVSTFHITHVPGTPMTVGKANAVDASLPTSGLYDDVQVIGRAFTADEITGDCTSEISVVDVETETLQSVVEALCERCGIPAGKFDATALSSITKPVRSFAIGRVNSTRAVLEQLASAYFFEGYCTDKLYFVPRGGSSVDTIDADYMGAEIA
jgi:hypothetical protein